MLYDELIRRYGVRTSEGLIQPKVYPLEKFELSKGAIVHYTPKTTAEHGINPRDPMLLHVENEIQVSHLEEYTDIQGNARRGPVNVRNLQKEYHRRYRRLRHLRRVESGLRDIRNVLIFNYAMLQHLYKYTHHALNRFYEWNTLVNTVYNNIVDLYSKTDRMHFIELPVVEQVPTLETLNRLVKKGVDRTTLDLVEGKGLLAFLDIYLWLTGNETLSTLNKLTPEQVNKITLVFVESGKFTLVPMSKLIELREDKGDLMGKAWIKFMSRMVEHRTVSAGSVDEVEMEEAIQGVTIPSTARSTAIESQCMELAEAGLLTKAEVNRKLKLAAKFKEIPNPAGEGTLEDLVKVTEDDVNNLSEGKIPDSKFVVDKSMLKSSLKDFDKNYANNLLEKDIANMVMALQDVGIAVANYKIKETKDAVNDVVEYSISVEPVVGKPSTITFKIPKVREDGTILVGSTKSKLVPQRGDVVIRKTGTNTVALTSYYGKLFITRNVRNVNNRSHWLISTITKAGLDSENQSVSKVNFNNVYDHSLSLPRDYSGIAKSISEFDSGQWRFNFNLKASEDFFGNEVVKRLNQNGTLVCGVKGTTNSEHIVIDKNNDWYHVKGNEFIPIENIFNFLNIPSRKEPTEVVEIKIMGKQVPIGIMLGYLMGLDELIKTLKVKHRLVPVGTRVNLEHGEIGIRFNDLTLVVSKVDPIAAFIFGSFTTYHKSISDYDYHEFDRKDVYFNVLSANQLGIRHLREMDNINDMFIDPISREILLSMEEPTKMIPLLIRSVELLVNDDHPQETDTAYMRFKGNERIPGMIYKELTTAVREYRSRPQTAKASLSINPKAVWLSVNTDAGLRIVEDSNPLHNLKTKEQVTYSGQGGRSGRTLVRKSRVYHENDRGVISEATPDSAKVAIDTFMTADPGLINLRGVTKRIDDSTDGVARNISTNALLVPGSTNDSPKRVNFGSIQASGNIPCRDYQTMPYRTGYDTIIAHRTDPLYASVSDQKCEVIEVTDKALVIKQEDGSIKSFELGKQYGVVAGETREHDITTNLKVGDTLEPGKVLAYNTNFFEPDFFDPSQVSMKFGVLSKVAFLESSDTLEDSCAISKTMSEKLMTPVAKTRSILVNFNQIVHGLVKEGDELEVDSVLCTLEDEFSGGGSLFNEEDLKSLTRLAANTPKAKSKGTVNKIEVIYHGDKEDMSDSVRQIANKYDRKRAKVVKEMLTDEPLTGQIVETGDGGPFIDKQKVTKDTLLIRIFITDNVPQVTGDKLVVGGQLKSVVGRVMIGENTTENDEPIDLIFGMHSVSNRIVLSPFLMGMANSLLKTISKQAVDIYKNG